MNFLPTTVTHPTRQPFVREISYIDEVGPPPLEFFDRTQDHISAYIHSETGWAWSAAREDFDCPVYSSATKMGSLNVTANLPLGGGIATSAFATGTQGEHGVVRGAAISAIIGYQFEATGGHIGAVPGTPPAGWFVGTGDFLVSCKVYNVNRARLDPYQNFGFWVGCGPRVSVLDTDGKYPAFCGGGNSPNWHIWCATPEQRAGVFFDTGILFHDATTMSDTVRRAWHVLQICRTNGAVRFFINGKLVRLTGNGLSNAEGVYWPTAAMDLRPYFQTRRSGPGSTSDGFYMDYFHMFAKRGA